MQILAFQMPAIAKFDFCCNLQAHLPFLALKVNFFFCTGIPIRALNKGIWAS